MISGQFREKAFLLTCLLRGMTIGKKVTADICSFLLTCLLRGMTARHTITINRYGTFLLTCLLRGMTKNSSDRGKSRLTFLLTCLLRGMTFLLSAFLTPVTFLLTCLLRGMTETGEEREMVAIISTHMPLARHDVLAAF